MRRGKQTVLIALGAVFVLPSLLSWFLFNYTDLGRGRGAGGHGTLIVPPRPLPAWTLVNPAASNGVVPRLDGKWTLIYPLNGSCQTTCLQNLYKMRQLRLAVGKHARRVQRAILVVNGDHGALTREQLLDYPGQLVLFPENTDRRDLVSLFELAAEDDPFVRDRLYLVDPLGNLMMSYAGTADPGGIIKDLTRLLKYSRSG